MLQVDSSSYNLSAVLRQEDSNRDLCVQSLVQEISNSERKCTEIENEVLAMVWSCKYFEMFLLSLKLNLRLIINLYLLS